MALAESPLSRCAADRETPITSTPQENTTTMTMARSADDTPKPARTPVGRARTTTRRHLELLVADAAYLLAMAGQSRPCDRIHRRDAFDAGRLAGGGARRWMLAPWLVPHLTVGYVVFALAAMLYVQCATRFEEADLLAELGERYRDYRRRVPAIWSRCLADQGLP
jgi:hypothetical protein